jgi:hydroxymethylpyrimidine pyrophosphatase-like HAD family hydrolase
MKKVLIAFDIDGTLRKNTVEDKVVPNERIRTLLITLASMKNTKILVWSGGGELYARQMVKALCIDEYVDIVTGKELVPTDDPNGVLETHSVYKPDIAFDDIHDCVLGAVNLIVREK